MRDSSPLFHTSSIQRRARALFVSVDIEEVPFFVDMADKQKLLALRVGVKRSLKTCITTKGDAPSHRNDRHGIVITVRKQPPMERGPGGGVFGRFAGLSSLLWTFFSSHTMFSVNNPVLLPISWLTLQ